MESEPNNVTESDTYLRIQAAVQAIEERSRSALTVFWNGCETCRVHFRNRIFTISREHTETVKVSLRSEYCFRHGFLGLVTDPDFTFSFLMESARDVMELEEQGLTWAADLGLPHLGAVDLMHLLAINAIWSIKK